MTEGFEDMLMVMAYQGYIRSNVQTLQKLCRDWRRMATQKTGGQPKYAKSGDIDIEVNLERIRMCILGEAVALARDGEFQEECTKNSDGEILRESVGEWWGLYNSPREFQNGKMEDAKMGILCNAVALMEAGELEEAQ